MHDDLPSRLQVFLRDYGVFPMLGLKYLVPLAHLWTLVACPVDLTVTTCASASNAVIPTFNCCNRPPPVPDCPSPAPRGGGAGDERGGVGAGGAGGALGPAEGEEEAGGGGGGGV